MDVEVWGWAVRKKGVVVVQEAMDPQVPVILGMYVLKQLDRQMAQVIEPLNWKGLADVTPPRQCCRGPFNSAVCRQGCPSYLSG